MLLTKVNMILNVNGGYNRFMKSQRDLVMSESRLTVAAAINLVIVVAECIGLCICYQTRGWSMLMYYTQLSNILVLAACAVMSYFDIRCLIGKSPKIPLWAWVLKYAATSAIGLTFCVVIFVLGPGLGGWNGIVTFLTSGPMVYTHLLCPILCMLSFTMLEYKREVSSKTIWFALVFTAIYAIVAIAMNVLKIWDGPYPFLRVYAQSIGATIGWCVLILGGAVAIAGATLGLNRLRCRKVESK